MARVFVSVGSNIDPEDNVLRALRLLAGRVSVAGISTVYLTQPEGRPDQPQFYNCVVEAETGFPPRELKHRVLRKIEDELGRKRTGDAFAPRTIDLDLILYDDVVMETEELTLPDPAIPVRPFLALPLYELAPDLALPGSGLRVADAARALSRHTMKPLADYTDRVRKEILRGDQ
jgi:dihydroneopterin aldolase/2-amino-4-hydroxy-6-hydroxymethyldihydropteridine diphosphokinase